MRKILPFMLVALVLVAISGCSKPPEVEMQAANTAISAAKAAEAEAYAPDAYRTAMDTLNAANAGKQEQDAKFALFRSYTKSKNLFVSAEALAKQAETKAKAEKERVKAEVTGMLEQAGMELDNADKALAGAPVGKGNKADIELIKSDLSAARSAFDAAKAEFDAGKYLSVRPKVQTIIGKAQAIQAEIANAAAKAKGGKKR